VEITGRVKFSQVRKEMGNLQDPFMASIFGQNNDSKYQKNRLNESNLCIWWSRRDEGRGTLDLNASSFYPTRSATRGHGGCRPHFALVGTETITYD
jgi:hypothetical protein